MTLFDSITQPTLLLDEARARTNIARMAQKAKQSEVRFRPHFKTHQSAVVGEWFRPFDVDAITVSSVWMAEYFANCGWSDITIAFPVNWRQIESLRTLARQVRLGLLVDSLETARFLEKNLAATADAWVELDVGQHRSGVSFTALESITQICREISHSSHLQLRGALAHAGHLYHAESGEQIQEQYSEIVRRLLTIREQVEKTGIRPFELSWGDTPSCSLVDDLHGLDEIRPGNFVFYDAEQLAIGSCREEDIAVALACPVVSKPQGLEHAVVYGGAVHLSKEFIEKNGKPSYGMVALPEGEAWGQSVPGAFVKSLSQEHGVIALPPEALQSLRIGDLQLVLPIHSCLTVDLMQGYTTLQGQFIPTLGRLNPA